jgi:hypothetical protein
MTYSKTLESIATTIEDIDRETQETASREGWNNLMRDIRLHDIDNIQNTLDTLLPNNMSKEYFGDIQDKLPDLLKSLYEEAEVLYHQEETNKKYS